jgi:5-methylcytosine-specific restriction endonuclease McrA
MTMTRAVGRASTRWVTQTVNIVEPNLSSAAALVLLSKKLFSADKTIYTNCRMMKVRQKWMKLQMKTPDELGGLTCAICNRKGLNPFSKRLDKSDWATLDHVIDIQHGGSWFDHSNFQVACYECNMNKSRIK